MHVNRFGDQFENQIGRQTGALTKQFATKGGANGCRCQLNLCLVEEDDKFSIEETQF